MYYGIAAVLSAERWQNMPPQYMSLWHKNYFEPKALNKIADAGRAL